MSNSDNFLRYSQATNKDDHTLQLIESRLIAISEQRKLSKSNQPYRELRTISKQDGGPHVEIVDGQLHYVICERGAEYERQVAKDEDELLYWLVSDMTRKMASDWESRHRMPWHDPRTRWMNKQIKLLTKIDPNWAMRKFDEYCPYSNLKGLKRPSLPKD
jgi:hypothetical protein